MKNLLAIFLATALLVGCGDHVSGEDNYFSGAERESLYSWCVKETTSDTCTYNAQVVQDLVNKAGLDKDCVIQDFKMTMITYDSGVLVSSLSDCR
jgi:hypothetical protein